MLEYGNKKLTATKVKVAMPPNHTEPVITVTGDPSGECVKHLRSHGENVKAVCRDARKMIGPDSFAKWSFEDSHGNRCDPVTPKDEKTPVVTIEATP